MSLHLARLALFSAMASTVLCRTTNAQELVSQYNSPAGSLGSADVNHDGIPDVIIGDPLSGPLDPTHFRGSVLVRSGVDGSTLLAVSGGGSCLPPFGCSGDSLGQSICGAGDVNQDGREDVLATALGYARLYSGNGGAVLRTWDDARAISNAGDVNFDGVPDQLVGWPTGIYVGNPGGRAEVRSGKDDSILFTLKPTGVSAPNGNGLGTFGAAVSGGKDLNGDGFPDFLIGAPGDNNTPGGVFLGAVGSVWAYSGKDGSLLYEVGGDATNDILGGAIAVGEDANGDGAADFIVAARGYNNPGYARVFSGRDGVPLFTIPVVSGQFMDVASAGDFNNDGSTDFFVNVPQDVIKGIATPSVRAISGYDGSVLHLFSGSFYGNKDLAATVLGNISGDGRDEIAIGTVSKTLVYSEISGPWLPLGGAKGGSVGVPEIHGKGSLALGTLASIDVKNGLSNGVGFIVLGVTNASVPFKGGTLVPSLNFTQPFLMNAAGAATLSDTIPAIAIPSVYMQVWLLDPSAPKGVSATEGVLATFP